jgi:hypothetical protein
LAGVNPPKRPFVWMTAYTEAVSEREQGFRSPIPQRELLVYSDAPRTINSSAFLLQFDDDRRMIRRLFQCARFFIDLAAS